MSSSIPIRAVAVHTEAAARSWRPHQRLPPIDYVLVTHAHFDHLHKPSLRAIARMTRRKSGAPPQIIVPRGVHDLIYGLGYREIAELSGGRVRRPGLLGDTRSGTPLGRAHVTRLSPRLRRIRHPLRRTLYLSRRDTAYFGGFREIGNRLRPRGALLPIGAYKPASYRNVHTSPEDAVRAFIDLGAEWMVPMHYGTFRLSHEPMEEPVQLLEQEAIAAGVMDRVHVLEEA